MKKDGISSPEFYPVANYTQKSTLWECWEYCRNAEENLGKVVTGCEYEEDDTSCVYHNDYLGEVTKRRPDKKVFCVVFANNNIGGRTFLS